MGKAVELWIMRETLAAIWAMLWRFFILTMNKMLIVIVQGHLRVFQIVNYWNDKNDDKNPFQMLPIKKNEILFLAITFLNP